MLSLLALYRLTLVTRGHFFWGDETRYLQSRRLVDALLAGDVRAAAATPFDALARPGFVLLGAIPALGQRAVAAVTGTSLNALANYDVVSIFNVLVSIALTLAVYTLGRCWFSDRRYAALMGGVFSLLCFANVWIRHLMPYYLALLMFVVALAVVCGQRNETGHEETLHGLARTWFAGALTALGFTCYPTYYAFVGIIAAVLLAQPGARWRRLAAWMAGGATVTASLEALSRVGGTSFIGHTFSSVAAHNAAGSSHGLYDEGYVFVWRYLRDVEGPAGLILAGAFLLFLLTCLCWRRSALSRPARVALLAATAGYLFHATMSVVFHRTIFFARFLGMYLPFVVGGAVLWIAQLSRPRWRKAAAATLVIASLTSFASFVMDYASLTYPADLFFQTLARCGIDTDLPPYALWGYAGGEADSVEEMDARFTMVMDARPEGTESPLIQLASFDAAAVSDAPILGVNLKWVFYYRERDERFEPPPTYTLVGQAVSPTSQAAIVYDAYKPWERRRLMDRRYVMRIYQRSDLGAAATIAARSPGVGGNTLP